MSMIETTGNIGYAILIGEEALEAFNDIMITKFTNQELIERSEYPEEFDPEYPLDVISDMEDAEDLYQAYLDKEYPLLEVYSYNTRYGQVDGYAVFITSTHSFVDLVGFKTIEPTEEELAQLRKFQQEFAPHQEIGQMQWTHVG